MPASPHTPSPPHTDAHLQARRDLRHALGHFATGVTVITAQGAEPESWVGLTVNSFSSVSLAPALVLWSIANTSPNLAAFAPGAQHVIHILAHDQKELAYRFAQPQLDKFAGVNYTLNDDFSAPVIANCVARFYCETERVLDGGDHRIILAHVLRFDTSAQAPLLFVKGQMHAHETLAPV